MTIGTSSAGAKNALGVLEKLEGPDIKVYPGRCVEVRNRNAGCHACAEACTSGAITVADGLLSVDEALCIGCGTCASVCPTCALEARHPDDEDLLARCAASLIARGGTEAVIVCTELAEARFGCYDEAAVAEVRCLGRVDESLLAALAERGCERVVLAGRHCDTCLHKTGRQACEEAAASATDLLEAWGAPIEITFENDMPEAVRAAGCTLLSPCEAHAPTLGTPNQDDAPNPVPCCHGARSEASDPDSRCPAEGTAPSRPAPAAPAIDLQGDPKPPRPTKVGRDGTLPHHVPTRRGRLLASLAALGSPVEATVTSRLWGTVSIDTDACGSCRLCAVFCPTGALAKFDDRGTGAFGIDHTPAKCVKCRCCADICPKHAVTITEEVFAPDIVDGHVERFEMRPRDVEPGRPETVVKKMRGLLSDSQFVNFA